MTDLDRFFLY